MAVKRRRFFFWVLMACGLVCRYQSLGAKYKSTKIRVLKVYVFSLFTVINENKFVLQLIKLSSKHNILSTFFIWC